MDKALQTMVDNMLDKTGKSLEEWKKLLASKSFAKHMEAVNYLKKEHGVTHGYANTIVGLSKSEDSQEQDFVSSQYEGKEALKPIYDKLVKIVKKFGKDVEIVPKKSSVSIKTSKQFAIIKPATKTRIDLGLKLKDVNPKGRLESSGPFGSMCTHRVQLCSAADVDDELVGWLTKAYQKSL